MFEYKKLARVIGITPATNVPALKMLLMLGFRIEGTLRAKCESGGGQDVLSTMFSEECPWLARVQVEGSDHGEV
jgi:hypothetical protein